VEQEILLQLRGKEVKEVWNRKCQKPAVQQTDEEDRRRQKVGRGNCASTPGLDLES